MQANDSTALESVVTDDCTDFPERAARALTEKMTVLPDQGRVKEAADLYLVVSESGSEYLVDVRDRVCECPDNEIDPQLGIHIDADVGSCARLSSSNTDDTTRDDAVETDGGEVIGSDTAESPVSDAPSGDEPTYTYHYEPAHVGGKRYVRCTVCGAECIPAKPSSLAHRKGCSEGQR